MKGFKHDKKLREGKSFWSKVASTEVLGQNRGTSIIHIQNLYKLRGKTPPRIVWLESPIWALWLKVILTAISADLDTPQFRAELKDSLGITDVVYDSLEKLVDTFDEVPDLTSVYTELVFQHMCAIRGIIDVVIKASYIRKVEQTFGKLYNPVLAESYLYLSDMFPEAYPYRLESENREERVDQFLRGFPSGDYPPMFVSTQWTPESLCGTLQAHWAGFYSHFDDLYDHPSLAVALERDCPQVYSACRSLDIDFNDPMSCLRDMFALVCNAGWVFPMEGLCLATDRWEYMGQPISTDPEDYEAKIITRGLPSEIPEYDLITDLETYDLEVPDVV